MVKFMVLKTFRDIHTQEVYAEETEIDMTVKRAKEVEKNLDGSFLDRIEVLEEAADDEGTD